MNPNERPTPLTDKEAQVELFKAHGHTGGALLVPADFARDLERKLAQVTEERDKFKVSAEAWEADALLRAKNTDFAQQERDDALAKFAKCRETLQILSQWALPPSHEITRIARETLEQTN